jgi:hypothetical protein
MRTSVKILVTAGVVAVFVMVGVMLGWFGTRDPKIVTIPPGNPVAGSSNTTARTNPAIAPANPRSATNQAGVVKPVPVPQVPGVIPNPNVITNWEERLDTILGSEGEESEKSKQLFAIFSRLPEEGQVEVVQHLSNLVADQDYAELGKLLVDPTLPEDVLEQLMADILNRPNSLKLPLLLEVARNPQHSKAQDAKDLLELYLEEDYGQDWTKWQAKLDEWVKQNPD